MRDFHIMQQEAVDKGELQIRVRDKSTGNPIPDARISISATGGTGTIIEEVTSDESGNSETLDLPTPPLEYSMQPSANQPYSEYTVTVSEPGYRDFTVAGVDLLPNETAIQEIDMEVMDSPGNTIDEIVIPEHTLFGDYPAKIPEEEIKSVNDSGEIVLSRVVVPEYVVVHDGVPSDNTARNYYVRYRDYIKNVASSEIYATWPDATIRANVLAIMSFTLNRVYTEW